MRSSPWSDVEMDAIHSLQLILRGTLDDDENARKKVSLDSRIRDIRLEGMLELESVTNEMVRLIESAMVPILAVGVDGMVNGWNRKIAELTDLPIDRAIGKHLLTLLVKDCSAAAVKKMIYSALKGNEEQNIQFQLKTHGDRADDCPVFLIVNACVNHDLEDHVAGVCFIAHDMTDHKMVMDKFTRIEGDYKAIVQNPNPLIPPIFGADEFWWCSEWNSAMGSFSGWERGDVMDKMLLGEVFGTNIASCRLKNQDALVNLSIIVSNAMVGQETVKAPFAFVNRDGKHMECLLSVSRKVDGHGVVTGVFCFLHVASLELQQVLHVQQLSEQTTMKKLKALSYIRHEIKNPYSGITYSRKMLEGTHLGEEQKQLLSTGEKCHLQLDRIIDDMNLESIMDSCLEMEMVEFFLGDVVTAVTQIRWKSLREVI